MPESGRRDARLDHLFQSLLRLHKSLLDDERVSYERVHGRIPSNEAFLQLVLGDAGFAWLRPLSQLMVRFDELMEEDEESARTEIIDLLTSARTLLTPTEEGDGFGRQYHDSLQRGPDVVLAHAAVTALLRQSLSKKE